MHQVERVIDLVQLHDVGDHRVDLDLAVHVPVDDLGHVGAPFRATEGRAAPVAPGDQLEGPCADFLAGLGHADNDRGAPAAMTAFQRLAHHIRIAGTIEGIVRAAIGQFDEMGDHISGLLRIDEMRHPEFLAPFLLGIVDVDTDDLVGARHLRALQHVEADAAQAEHDDIVTDLNLGRIGHRAHARRHAATDIAGLVEGRVGADFRNRDFRQDGEVRKGRAAHIMVDRFALVAKPARAIRHQALALRRADRGTEIGLAGKTAFALAAFRRVERDHMIARLHAGHARADFAYNACALMAEHAREDALTVQPVQRVGIGMADAGRHDLDQDFPGLRAFQIQFDNFQRFLGFKGDSGARFHEGAP